MNRYPDNHDSKWKYIKPAENHTEKQAMGHLISCVNSHWK